MWQWQQLTTTIINNECGDDNSERQWQWLSSTTTINNECDGIDDDNERQWPQLMTMMMINDECGGVDNDNNWRRQWQTTMSVLEITILTRDVDDHDKDQHGKKKTQLSYVLTKLRNIEMLFLVQHFCFNFVC